MGTPRGALLPWLVRQLDLHPARIDTWLGERRLGQPINAPLAETLLYFLLWWRDDAPVRAPDALGYPLARHFRDRGLASLRTGWGPQDWLVSHVCGRQHHAGHRQGDANHVSFYALGESFLVDAGYGDLAAQADTTARRRPLVRRDRRPQLRPRGRRRASAGTHPTPGWAEGEILDFVTRPTPSTPPSATPPPAPGPTTASARRCAASSSSAPVPPPTSPSSTSPSGTAPPAPPPTSGTPAAPTASSSSTPRASRITAATPTAAPARCSGPRTPAAPPAPTTDARSSASSSPRRVVETRHRLLPPPPGRARPRRSPASASDPAPSASAAPAPAAPPPWSSAPPPTAPCAGHGPPTSRWAGRPGRERQR